MAGIPTPGPSSGLAEDAAGQAIDLLLTDIVMTHMGGRELAERLLARQAVSRVLYTSGYADESMLHHGRLEPGTELMPKPFSPDTLLNRVREVLAER